MMFMQYWPLGVWVVTIWTYVAANTGEQGTGTFSAGFLGYSAAAGAIGSLLSPVLIGYVSDRYFAAERLTAVMHVGCALSAWGMHESQTEMGFFLWLVAYFQFFVPTVSLTNKIGLHHLADVDTEFPWVRIFGTVGWIGAGLFVGLLWPELTGESIEATRVPLLIGVCGNLLMALFVLTMPRTPPERAVKRSLAKTMQAGVELLANRPLVVFLVVSLLACIPSMAYTSYANPFLNMQGYPKPAALLTIGQVSEVICLWAMAWFIPRIGLKWLFVTGVLAWGVRYVCLAAGASYGVSWPVYLSIVIHGPCYVFIYIVGQVYIDRLVDPAHRGAAQGMHALASTGLGHLLGALFVGYAQEILLTPEGVSPPPYHWTAFWLAPAVVCVVTALLFKVAFRPPEELIESVSSPAVAAPPADALAEAHED